MKIIDAIWFMEMGSLQPIGIVIGRDNVTGEAKAYIGSGAGLDETADAQHIAEIGAKFHLQTALIIAAHLRDAPSVVMLGEHGRELPLDVVLLTRQAKELGKLLAPTAQMNPLRPERPSRACGICYMPFSMLHRRRVKVGSKAGELFPLGNIVATPGALEAIGNDGITGRELILRHSLGDWGEMPPEDKALNDEAVVSGGRLMSAYSVNGKKIWIITESDRSATTICLPEDY